MIKNLVHLTLLSYIWKRYKTIIIATMVLFAYFWLIGKLHDDFVSYSQLNNDAEYLGLSFVIKWLLYISGAVSYFLFNNHKLKKISPNDSQQKSPNSRASSKQAKSTNRIPPQKNGGEDPFQRIREKESLRSQADVLIENNHKTD